MRSPRGVFNVSPQSRSLFSASFQTFCLTKGAYLNTQKYELFCSLNNFSHLWKFRPDIPNSFGNILFEKPQNFKECMSSLAFCHPVSLQFLLTTIFPVAKTLFTWSGGPRSSGVSFFCFVSPRA